MNDPNVKDTSNILSTFRLSATRCRRIIDHRSAIAPTTVMHELRSNTITPITIRATPSSQIAEQSSPASPARELHMHQPPGATAQVWLMAHSPAPGQLVCRLPGIQGLVSSGREETGKRNKTRLTSLKQGSLTPLNRTSYLPGKPSTALVVIFLLFLVVPSI